MSIKESHVFSCINIRWVLRKVFEHEVDRRKHLPRDRASIKGLVNLQKHF